MKNIEVELKAITEDCPKFVFASAAGITFIRLTPSYIFIKDYFGYYNQYDYLGQYESYLTPKKQSRL